MEQYQAGDLRGWRLPWLETLGDEQAMRQIGHGVATHSVPVGTSHRLHECNTYFRNPFQDMPSVCLHVDSQLDLTRRTGKDTSSRRPFLCVGRGDLDESRAGSTEDVSTRRGFTLLTMVHQF